MSNGIDEYEDRVATALVGGSVYERLRYQRRWLFTHSIGRKLRWQSIELFLLAAGLPLLFGVPSGVASGLQLDPFEPAPKVAVLGLVGAAITFLSGLCLVAIALLRTRLEPMGEATAESVLALEEIASLVGFLTGGTAIAITLLFVLLGVADAGFVDSYTATLGADPLADTGAGIPVAVVAALAFVGGVTLHSSAALLDRYVAEG